MKNEFYYRWTVLINLLLLFPIFSPLLADWLSWEFYVITSFSILITIVFLPRFKSILKWVNSKPAITVTKEAFHYHISGQKVLWSDIDSLKIGFNRGPYLSIRMKAKVMDMRTMQSPFSRFLFKTRSKIFPDIYKIDLNYLINHYDTIYETINKYFALYRNAG